MKTTPNASRIVTRNLLVSASYALSPEAADRNEIAVSNVRDLCTLINLAVLHDEIETIGNASEFDCTLKPKIAPEYEKIREATGLKLKIGPQPGEFERVISEASSVATRPFAQVGEDASLGELRSRLMTSLRNETWDRPDYWIDFLEGRKLGLSRAPDEDGKDKAAEDFWYRSFLYLGFAQVRKTPFVPDTIRSWGTMDSPTPSPLDYSSELQVTIEQRYRRNVRELMTGINTPIPAFAACVFSRAGGEQSRISFETKHLRDELTGVRVALHNLQEERNWGEYAREFQTLFAAAASDESRSSVDKRFYDALERVRKGTVPMPPQVLKLQPLFSVLKATAEVVLHVISPLPSSWYQGLKEIYELGSGAREIATGVSELESFADEGAFAEVHNRLGWDLRNFLTTEVKLENLFGRIREDEPQQAT